MLLETINQYQTPTGNTLQCKGWIQEAALRMLLNNIDPEVAERPEELDYVERRTLPDIELCNERGFAVSLGEWRREIFGVAAPLYRTPTGECLSVNCGIPSFRFSAEQIERECGPRILGLARSIRSLVANS